MTRLFVHPVFIEDPMMNRTKVQERLEFLLGEFPTDCYIGADSLYCTK
ncbi:hypothetical protein NC99_27000 [Sunxiuqinia dokdonensis]|uniref:Uncharacterized protein n=1 Tax=Sunxiuqinia dokdonensis TaxID=1409788 RepID=A0A0L8V7K9_9BACT|nr:hypothetical protein NC99_27000 [Sunxiuqinia dokdonensis]